MSKKYFTPIIMLIIALLMVGCGKTEQVPKKEETENTKQLEIKEAKKEDAEAGLVSPILDHASEKTIVFHDYFGLFVYSLEKEQIVKSINIKDLGFEYVQGDDAVSVRFDEEKGLLTLYTLSNDHAVEIDINKNTAKVIDGKNVKKDMDQNIQGELTISNIEFESLLYKPNSGDKEYYPLKDFK